PVSARSEAALRELAGAYAAMLAQEAEPSGLIDVVRCAATRREHLEYRAVVVGADKADMIEALAGLHDAGSHPAAVAGHKDGADRHGPVFVFTGMGPQWWGMGQELHATEPVFRAALERCTASFEKIAGWSLLDAMLASEETSRMGETEVAQPANFVLQVALAELWRSWGITPSAIVGHSAGEPAAAYVAGALSLEDAITVIFHRSRLQQRTAGQGRMMSVGISLQDANKLLADLGDTGLSIAAVNSPESVAVAGSEPAVTDLYDRLQDTTIFARILHGNVPYHSHFMDPLEPELLAALRAIQPRGTTVPLYSTVAGNLVDGTELDGDYWFRNVRHPVEFLSAMARLIDDGYRNFLEIGPNPVLASSIRESLKHFDATGDCLLSLRRGQPEQATILRTVGELHVRGYPIDWTGLYGRTGAPRRLPKYRWQHERMWHERPSSLSRRTAGKPHPILARVIDSPVPTWEVDLESPALTYLEDHKIQGAVVFPGAGYVEMASAAARDLFGGTSNISFDNVEFKRILFLNDDDAVCLRIEIDPRNNGFTISSRKYSAADPKWETHATGRLLVRKNNLAPNEDLAAIKSRCRAEIPREACYQHFRNIGLEYGETFQGIMELWQGEEEALARIEVPATLVDTLRDYVVHPAIMDICFQTLAAALPISGDAADQDVYMPVGVREGWIMAPSEPEMWIHARITGRHEQGLEGDIRLLHGDGRVVVAIDRCTAKSLKTTAGRTVKPQSFYDVKWVAQPPAVGTAGLEVDAGTAGLEADAGTWLILGGRNDLTRGLADRLAGRDQTCYLACPGKGFGFDGTEFTFDPADPNGVARILEHLGRHEPHPLRGVVHLLAVDRVTGEIADRASIDEANLYGCVTLLHALQALAGTESAVRPKLWVATRNAQPVTGDASGLNLFQSPLWGMAKVAGQIEHRDLWGAIIDLDGSGSGQDADLLIEELFADHGEDQVAFRAGTRYVPRLTACPEVKLPSMPAFRSDVSYLITGGLGALGLVAAHWIVERGGCHLILTSRDGIPPRHEWATLDAASAEARRVAAVRELERAGAHVRVVAADVSEEADVNSIVELNRREGYPPIRGIIHTAGTALPKLLMNMDAAELNRILKPKVQGAWYLHKAFANEPLDFFTMFSSIASVVISTGQGNDSAANAFLDALAHWRQSNNKAGLSIN
ncbi:MAG TPA: acyltransferase domain-containing protein, partial [Arenibaculum sp.]|nr:acyltransferase domain-containing protein [Arenibaculum sp.]